MSTPLFSFLNYNETLDEEGRVKGGIGVTSLFFGVLGRWGDAATISDCFTPFLIIVSAAKQSRNFFLLART